MKNDRKAIRTRPVLMPLLSSCVFSTISTCCACMHMVAPSLSKYTSTLMIGGLFSLIIVPVGLCSGVVFTIQSIFPSFPVQYLTYFGYTFSAIYTVQILLLDKSHLHPFPLDQCQGPRSWLEQKAYAFWMEHFSYFPMTVVANEQKVKLPADKQYIFAVHPHGIHCWPLNCLCFPSSPFDKKFPGLVGKKLTGLAATVVFKIPVVRELFLSMGYIDAGRENAANALDAGRSLFICTGGEDEAMRSRQGEDTVVLLNRKGFVRLALSYGCALVPVFGVGVNDLYKTYDLGTLRMRQKLQKSTGVALPIFHGVFGTPLPYQTPIKVLIGEPIDTPAVLEADKGKQVDPEVVDKYHKKYIDAVKRLYKEYYAAEKGGASRSLVIV